MKNRGEAFYGGITIGLQLAQSHVSQIIAKGSAVKA